MTKLETFKALREAMRDPTRIGDVGIYKSELAGGGARKEIEQALETMGDAFPAVDLDALAELPRATLGREYAEFLRANGLEAFRISDRIGPELLRRNMFIARYSLFHDVFHVLTGFDTSPAGELGVWAFVAAQRYSAGHWLAVLAALLVYPFLAPRQILKIWHNLRRGVRMGRQARTLITVPFETMWDRPVAELRRELDVDPASELDAQVVLA